MQNVTIYAYGACSAPCFDPRPPYDFAQYAAGEFGADADSMPVFACTLPAYHFVNVAVQILIHASSGENEAFERAENFMRSLGWHQIGEISVANGVGSFFPYQSEHGGAS